MKAWDAIVIGGGHNGLVNACYLQRAGLDVLVLEKNDWVGGAATSRELTPGFLYSNCSYVCSLFRPEIMRDLELPRFGLQVISYEGGAVFTRDGDYLANYRDHDAHRREFARFSKRDAEAYDRYSRDVTRQCRFIQPLLMRTAPDPTSFKPRDLGELLYLGKKFAGLTAEEMALTLRFWTMSISDFLDEYFETDVIKANFALSGIIGTALGPMSPGTAYVLLHHYMGEVDGSVGAWGYARGGMGAVTKALAASFKASGGTIRTGAEVDHVLVGRGKAKGVVLAGGEEIYGKLVVSNADVKRTFLKLVEEKELPDIFLRRVRNFKIRGSSGKLVVSNADVKRTFLKLVEEKELPDIFLRRVKNFKIRGSSGKVNIALDSLPEFPALPKDSPVYRGDMHFTDSMERMERAYDDWKAGRWSADPFLDMVIPTTLDPTMAPPGKHFMSCFVQYAPPKIGGADWTDTDRDGFAESVVAQISEYSPGFRDRIVHMEVRTPREIEAEVGLTEGNIFQGELTFDQLLFNRPVPGYAQYRSPVGGLYMCGSSTHPGGGVMGAPGRNAAAEILRDLAKSTSHMSPAHDVI